MKKLPIFIFILYVVLSCTSTKIVSDIGKGIKHKTSNPNTPYIYKKGFKSYTVKPILTVHNGDSTFINELKFNAVYSSFYTKKVMFDKFGKWDREIRPNNERHPVLIWEKRKLFNTNESTYYVAAGGDENWNEIYASVMVFDSKNFDCLNEDHVKKDSLIHLFSKGIRNLNSNKQFYKIYWKMIKEYDKKK
jgi:hypothetical protein